MKLILFVFVGVDQVIVEMTWKTQNVDEKLRTWSQFNEASIQVSFSCQASSDYIGL